MKIESIIRPGEFASIGQLIFSDDRVGVTDGGYVLGMVSRASLTGYRLEYRSSFKHPRAGFLMGVILAGLPLQTVAGDPLNLGWLILSTPLRMIASFCMFTFGAAMLVSVACRRDIPWIVFERAAGERAFPLQAELPPEAVAVMDQMCERHAEETQ
ncbi:MAG: hypothetical protein GC162_14620 [Planctomycetes bacterium]|nr:hypothetical protein [Planctomycetota bacterium]